MKKALVLLVLGLMIINVGNAQSWVTFGNNDTQIEQTVELSNGNLAAIGNTPNGSIIYLLNPFGIKIDSIVTIAVAHRLHSIIANSRGGFTVTGSSNNNNQWVQVIDYDSFGGVNWNRSYGTGAGNITGGEGLDIVENSDSSLTFIYRELTSSSEIFTLCRVDIFGNIIWEELDATINQNYNLNYGLVRTANDNYYFLYTDYPSPDQILNKYNNLGVNIASYALSLSVGISSFILNDQGEIMLVGAISIGGGWPPNGYRPVIYKLDSIGGVISSSNINPYDSIGCAYVDIVSLPNNEYAIAADVFSNRLNMLDSFPQYALLIYDDNLSLIDSVMVSPTEFWGRDREGVKSICLTQDGGLVLSGYGYSPQSQLSWFGEGVVLKFDPSLVNHQNVLFGKVIGDLDNNCTLDSSDALLPHQIVKATGISSQYMGYSDFEGEYNIRIRHIGDQYISVVPKSEYWSLSGCQTGQQLYFQSPDTLELDLYLTPQIYCPDLTVSINTPFLRRCFHNNYMVEYCNLGTLAAYGAYIEIEMDPYLTIDSASIPVVSQVGNLYRFNVDTVGIGQCGRFNLYVNLDCDSTELGQTHCVSAHIYPDSICLPPDPAWDGSSVAVTGSCDVGDTLDLKIENVGTGDMTSPSFFLIAEDNVMYQSGNFQLLSGDSLKYRFKGNGSTFTLIANQVEGHPGSSFPMVSIEGCGTNNQGTFSKGFVTQYPQDDQNGYVDILCLQNIGAYDPNDKRAEPQGLDNEGYITATQPLDYTVRFQNTGTDTAFTVVLRDTLSANLDITTLYLTGASHPYTFQIIGSNVLEWTFPNILLPDSNVNEPLSHGFVSFGINQIDGNAPGTEITNRAGIYFDFNPPIITNTTLNTVIADYKTWFTFIQSPESKLQLGIYPNPNNGTFSLDFTTQATNNYEFVMYDLAGTKQFGQTLTGNAPYVMQPDLPTGMYIYQLLENGVAVNMGKVVVNR